MMKCCIRLVVISLFSYILLGCASSPPPVALKSNPLWSSHTLENGFTYHLRHSEKAPVSMRLIVHSGSLQETEQQLGYAHFLEHMAFNGTKHFKGNDIVALFEQAGASFGADLNAYTSFHETIYKLDLSDDSSLEKGLLWFGDISQHIRLEGDEVEKEKGVVLGEIRRSRPENQPLAYKYYDHLLESTQYHTRDPIGTKESINNLSLSALNAYYDQWYQPSRNELVIYGNFNQSNISSLIKQQFENWEETSTETQFEPNTTGQRYNFTDLISTVEEYETPSYGMVFDRGDRATTTVRAQQEAWLDEIAHTVIRQRLSTRFMDAALPVVGLYSIDYLLPYQRLFLTEITFPPETREANQSLFQTTIAELRDYGISQEELELVNSEWQTRLNNLDTDWNNTNAETHADGKVTSLILGQPAQDREQHRQNLMALTENLSVSSINRHLRTLLSSDYQLVIGVDPQEDISQVTALAPKWRENTDARAKKPLMLAAANTAFNAPKMSGSIVSQQALDSRHNIHTWSLSNGVEVWYQKDQSVGNKIHMVLASRGGKTALDPTLFVASDIAINTVSRSGIGDFDGSSLDSHLRRHDLSLIPFIHFTQHGIELQSNQKNLTDSFAALHTVFTDINIDEAQLEAVKQEYHQSVASFLSSPIGPFTKELNHISYFSSSPHFFQELSDIDAVSSLQIEQVHRDLFTRNRNYKLVIIGNVDASELTPLLRKYIASIPLTRTNDEPFTVAYRDYQNERIDVSTNTENTSHYLLRMTNPKTEQRGAKEIFIDDMLQRMLTQRLTTHVREELSLDYAPYAFSVTQDSELASDWMLTADTDPKDVEKVELAIDNVVRDLLLTISEGELAAVGSQLVNDLVPIDNDAPQRSWFYARYLIHGYGLDPLFDPQAQVDKISLSDVQQRAALIFGDDSIVVKGILRPKS
ncbi:M16 family metallopeptidase [Vibrio genomosp. F10]|nr:M16 family metallopeptidase [Vibrio genomosp. F10]